MEESIGTGEREDLLEQIRKTFELKQQDVRSYSSLALAFIGDCIYDLIIRTLVLGWHNTAPGRLHAEKSLLVRAQAQAEMSRVLQEELTEEEAAVYRRGRNARSGSVAKNASVADYRKATGLEALYGYLYLTGQTDRLLELIRLSLEKLEWGLNHGISGNDDRRT